MVVCDVMPRGLLTQKKVFFSFVACEPMRSILLCARLSLAFFFEGNEQIAC